MCLTANEIQLKKELVDILLEANIQTEAWEKNRNIEKCDRYMGHDEKV